MRSHRTLLQLVLSTGAGMAVAVAFLSLMRAVVPTEVLRAHSDAAGTYLQTVGTVYAVLLAFAVFVVWSQYTDARHAVEHEANEIADLERIVSGFAEAHRSRIQARLRAYIAAVVSDEWEAMEHGHACPRTRRALERLWQALAATEPVGARQESLFGEALARFNDLSDCRRGRLVSSNLRLPRSMWIVLGVGAVVTIGSMALLGVDAFVSHAVMTGALAGLVCLVLFVIWDLDTPFTGDWSVASTPIAAALDDRAAVLRPRKRPGRFTR